MRRKGRSTFKVIKKHRRGRYLEFNIILVGSWVFIVVGICCLFFNLIKDKEKVYPELFSFTLLDL